MSEAKAAPDSIDDLSRCDPLFERGNMAINTSKELKGYSNEVRQEILSSRKIIQQKLNEVKHKNEKLLKSCSSPKQPTQMSDDESS